MYARKLKDTTLTLAVSGMLWRDSLVMIDKETGSLWNHLLGEAFRGPLVGEELQVIPSIMTDWKTWKARHPETTCLAMSRTDLSYTSENWSQNTNLLMGIASGKQSRAWSLPYFRETPLVNDTFAGRSLLAVYDEKSGTAVLHGREVDGKSLTFQLKAGKLVDQETGTQWDLISGNALSPPLLGKTLPKVNGMISYHHAWRSFHPDSTYWEPDSK